ncbi:hypothetical protein [Halorubrum sp. Atlit-26R]|uniref:hypothetical protein n=1 Tax=Halorubrum sp. Atlit-26R TaxID=2282128 RepID=UPI0011C40D27|nr:hypothetical protein [Halorubrum sp. Atlit-26R]
MCQKTTTHTTEDESDTEESEQGSGQSPESATLGKQQENEQESKNAVRRWFYEFRTDNIRVYEWNQGLTTLSAIIISVTLGTAIPLTWDELSIGQVGLLLVGILVFVISRRIATNAKKSMRENDDEDGG